MPVTLQHEESHWEIRLEGQVTLAAAEELKKLLLEWVAARKDLTLDLQRVEAIDLTIMQLLWAAGREATHTGTRIVGRIPDALAVTLREAGFAGWPGFEAED